MTCGVSPGVDVAAVGGICPASSSGGGAAGAAEAAAGALVGRGVPPPAGTATAGDEAGADAEGGAGSEPALSPGVLGVDTDTVVCPVAGSVVLRVVGTLCTPKSAPAVREASFDTSMGLTAMVSLPTV